MFKHLFLLLFASALVLPVLAQEQKDSVQIVGSWAGGLTEDDILELQKPISPTDVKVGEGLLQPSKSLANDLPLRPDLEPEPMPVHWYNFSPLRRGDYLPYWSTGRMYGSNGMVGDRLNGYTSYATMGVTQQLGEYWMVNAGMSLEKSMFYNAASFNAMVNYHPSRYFELTAFASYMPGSFISQMQMMPTFQWGGNATFQSDTDVPFGIDLGVRDEYNQFNGHHVSPIVQPFVKIGGSKIGIDFGPFIDGAIHKDKQGWGGRGMNPIPQPIKAIPQVAPRR